MQWTTAEIAVVVSIIVAVVGAGAIGRWLAAGQRAQLLDVLDERYTRRWRHDEAVEELEERVDRAERAAQLAITNADGAMSTAQRVELTQSHLSEQVQREVLRPLQDITREQRKTSEQLAATAALVAEIVRRLDRMHPAP
jgi:hypothetical protein